MRRKLLVLLLVILGIYAAEAGGCSFNFGLTIGSKEFKGGFGGGMRTQVDLLDAGMILKAPPA